METAEAPVAGAESTPAAETVTVVPDAAISAVHHSPNAPGAGERSAPLMARPDWVPEKFFKDGVIDYKGIATENKYLASKSGEPKVTEPKAGEPKKVDGEPKVTEKSAGEQKPTFIAGVIPGVEAERVTAYTAELNTTGKLSPASYTELAGQGFSKEVVDVYLAGLTKDAAVSQAVSQAVDESKIAQKELTSIIDGIGGDAALTEMLQWAKTNLSAADKKVYDAEVASNDPAKVRMAVNGLKHRFTQEHGTEPQFLEVGGGSRPADGAGLTPYNTNDEVVKDMSTREYKTDPAFRAKVEARLRVSNVFEQSKDNTKVQR